MKKTVLFAIIVIAGWNWRLPAGDFWKEKVDPVLLRRAESTQIVDFIVMLENQAELPAITAQRTKNQKGRYVYQQLSEHARRTQSSVLQLLQQRGTPHRSFFIVNAIYVKGDIALIQALAERPEVKAVIDNSPVRVTESVYEPEQTLESRDLIEWGIERINADDVWAMGYTGQGAVVAGADTGYEWDHPAIKDKYRGWNGAEADHSYNWHDGVHELNPLNQDSTQNPANNPCGLSSLVPCDDHSHGTHTMGTMVGDDGQGNQIGVAPGARWVACRNMERGWGSPATYIECFEFFLAPTDINNANPDPAKSPHVINNSWGCPEQEGCNPSNFNLIETVVNNLKASGIVVVASAGNSGSGCETVNNPAAMFENAFSVGATRATDTIANFSSRGPVTVDGSGRLKPNVSAPGVGVRSSTRFGGYASWNGTSMAGPHVAGLVALIISANPELAGQVETIETIIEETAVPVQAAQDCGTTSGLNVPNQSYGYGRIDALAAVQRALEMVTDISQPGVYSPAQVFPNPFKRELTLEWNDAPQGPVHFELYNTTQQQVRSYQWTSNGPLRQTITLADLPAGVYIYRLSSGEWVQSGKVVRE
jgi:subtilisin family serine protease